MYQPKERLVEAKWLMDALVRQRSRNATVAIDTAKERYLPIQSLCLIHREEFDDLR